MYGVRSQNSGDTPGLASAARDVVQSSALSVSERTMINILRRTLENFTGKMLLDSAELWIGS